MKLNVKDLILGERAMLFNSLLFLI